jgi:hypothetical protein
VTSQYRYSLAVAGGAHVGPLAPMFLYSQIARGQRVGTTLQQNLGVLESQGITPISDYSYGTQAGLYDYTDQPSDTDRVAAAHYRLVNAYWDYWVHADERSIETWMSANHRPVVFVFNVYHNFEWAGQTDANGVSYPLLVQPPTEDMGLGGGHMVIGYRTDACGVWVMNSWGNRYGKNGWAELSWSFIAQQAIVYLLQFHSLDTTGTAGESTTYPQGTSLVASVASVHRT